MPLTLFGATPPPKNILQVNENDYIKRNGDKTQIYNTHCNALDFTGTVTSCHVNTNPIFLREKKLLLLYAHTWV